VTRPSLLTEEVTEACARHIRLGLTKQDSAVLAGIAPPTLHKYAARGEDDIANGRKTRYAEFVMALREAEASFKLSATATIVNAAQQPHHWQAAAWLLERRFPGQYRPVSRTEVTGEDGGPVQVEHHTVQHLVAQVRALRPPEPEPLALPPGPPANGHHSNGAS
jgi:hypothetical protein